MTLTQFKKDIAQQVGASYSLVARFVDSGEVKFTLPPRFLVLFNTVGLGFSDDPLLGQASHIDFPKAKNFEGDITSFAFTNEGFGVKMEYTLT